MRALGLDDLDAESAAFDAEVARCADIDHFCSSSDWGLPAAQALMPDREPFIRAGDHGWLAMMAARHPVGIVLEPLEAMWALGCPLVAANVEKAARELLPACRAAHPRALLLLAGLMRNSPRFISIAHALNPYYVLRLGPPVRRHCADLTGGLDGFLANRSANVRRNLARALKRASDAGVTFTPINVSANDADAVYERILAVERKSWKAAEGVSILHSEMVGFYRVMLRRLARRGAVRLSFAQLDGEDVAYILGGRFGSTYRGLQFSQDRAHESLSLGNLSQYHQVRALAEEGVTLYDLGAEVDYKRRWGERVLETVSILALPR